MISRLGCTCNPGFVASENRTLCMGIGIIGLLLSNSRTVYLFQVV